MNKTDEQLRALVRKQSMRLAAQTACTDEALRRAVAVQSRRLAPCRATATTTMARPETGTPTAAASASDHGLMRLLALFAGRPIGMPISIVMARLAAGGAR